MTQCWRTLRRLPTVQNPFKLSSENRGPLHKMFVTFKWCVCFIQSFQLVDFEAMTTPSPDGFSKMAKSWMNLKRYHEEAELCLLFHFWVETEYFFFLPACPAGTRAFHLSQRHSHPPEPWLRFSTQTRLHTVPESPNSRGPALSSNCAISLLV